MPQQQLTSNYYVAPQGTDVTRDSIYSVPQQIPNDSDYGRGAISLGSSTQFQRVDAATPMNFNPFGTDGTECCDEWEGFCKFNCQIHDCACGGLKFTPGHLGLKWLKSKDNCDQTESIFGKRRSCRGGTACKGECGDKKCGLKARREAKQPCSSDCECSECTTGGLFSRN